MGSSIFELKMHISLGKFSKSYKNLTEIEAGLEHFNKKIVNDDKFHIYYLIAYGYFGVGEIEAALKWINKILNDKDVNQGSKLYLKSKIIILIIHYELGNVELLDYLIKST
jgi:tetratricopeptide (TPR) repeat protein